MVDEERVTRLASEVCRDLDRLHQLGQTEDLATQADQLDATKYRFLTAIEGCVSIAHHVIASEGWEAPDSNADAMRGLGKHGVIGAELADAMSRAAGFRDLLVHQYGRIDDEAVVGFLARLDQLDQFTEDVLTWLEDEANATSG